MPLHSDRNQNETLAEEDFLDRHLAHGGRRNIQITAWKPVVRNTLISFFSVTLPSGLPIHSVAVHAKGENRWLGMPAREWTGQDGTKQYAKLIAFADRAAANPFRDQVLAALDRYLVEVRP